MKTLLFILIVLLIFTPVYAQESQVREITVYTLATNDNALRYTVLSNLSSPLDMYEAGQSIVEHYVKQTFRVIPRANFSKEEQLLLYTHLMMWKHIGQIMMSDALENESEVNHHLYWADFWFSFYQGGLIQYAADYNLSQADLDRLWNTERFGPDPRRNEKRS